MWGKKKRSLNEYLQGHQQRRRVIKLFSRLLLYWVSSANCYSSWEGSLSSQCLTVCFLINPDWINCWINQNNFKCPALKFIWILKISGQFWAIFLLPHAFVHMFVCPINVKFICLVLHCTEFNEPKGKIKVLSIVRLKNCNTVKLFH